MLVSLQITSRVLQTNALKFAIPFQRVGASQAITDLSEQDSLIEKYDKQAEEIAALEEQQPKLSEAEARLH